MMPIGLKTVKGWVEKWAEEASKECPVHDPPLKVSADGKVYTFKDGLARAAAIKVIRQRLAAKVRGIKMGGHRIELFKYE